MQVQTNKEEQELADRISACLKECYLNSTPAIDLDTVTANKSINPNAHIIALSKFDEILAKHKVKISDSVFAFTNWFPKIDLNS